MVESLFIITLSAPSTTSVEASQAQDSRGILGML